MTAAVIWFIAAAALIAVEVLSGDFVFLMLGIGAGAAAGTSFFVDNQFVAVSVFAVVSIGLLVLARPALKRRYLHSPGLKTNIEALIGTQAITVSTVDADTGQVKIGGEVWSARTMVEGLVIESGEKVTVVEISGATAVVAAEP